MARSGSLHLRPQPPSAQPLTHTPSPEDGRSTGHPAQRQHASKQLSLTKDKETVFQNTLHGLSLGAHDLTWAGHQQGTQTPLTGEIPIPHASRWSPRLVPLKRRGQKLSAVFGGRRVGAGSGDWGGGGSRIPRTKRQVPNLSHRSKRKHIIF